ncbi:MAG: acetylornithine deacetylase [Gammaproteobacteria bacterium]
MTAKLPDFRAGLAELVATPSVSSIDPRLDMSNRPVVDLLANWYADLGADITLMPLPGNGDKCNLIAKFGGGEGGLVLSGHTDTVPYDANGWDSDPFALTEREGVLYGLGTSDMKSYFPLVLQVLRELDLNKLREPIYVLATADEESNMLGAQALAEANLPLGRNAIIGEPTGLRPVFQHKGVMMAAIRLIGRSGHSSDPALGVSALEGMHKVITDLLAWRSELQARYQNEAFKVPVPTMNLGCIHGGDNPNRICAECELAIDLRPLPGMVLAELKQALQERVQAAVRDMDLRVEFNDRFTGIEAMQTDRNAGIVTMAEQLSGQTAGSVAFGTEGAYFNAMGMETVVLGPGDIDVAHQPNECLSLARIEPMVKILRGMVTHFCMEKT